jgi:single-strand DNA-binding protein
MARGINSCTFIGNLGSDVEAKPVNDSHVANVSLAVNEEWGAGDERKSRVEWVSLVFWGKGAEILAQYCKKGSKIYVTGRLQTRDWVDDNNDKHYRTEVVVRDFLFLDSPGSTSTADDGGADDDLPF